MKHKERIPVEELHAFAHNVLLEAGFERTYISQKSEACYYKLPNRHGLLRLATHRMSKSPIGMDNVIAKLTFRGNCHSGARIMVCSRERIMTIIYRAIGQYVFRSTKPVQSNYKGKKGTWENTTAIQ